jgi:hypothetical protein
MTNQDTKRVEALARAWARMDGKDPDAMDHDCPLWECYAPEAAVLIRALDAHDAANGITRSVSFAALNAASKPNA